MTEFVASLFTAVALILAIGGLVRLWDWALAQPALLIRDLFSPPPSRPRLYRRRRSRRQPRFHR